MSSSFRIPAGARPRGPLRAHRRAGRAVSLVAAVLLGGCSEMQALSYSFGTSSEPPRTQLPSGAIVLQPLAPVRRDIFTRSYRLGEVYTVNAGAPVVSIKNYSITEKVGRATVLRDFNQTCRRRFPRGGKPQLCEDQPLATVRGAMGSVFDVAGAVSLPDGQYFAVVPPSDGRAQVYLLVDPTGRLRRGAYIAWRENLSPGYAMGAVPLVELAPEIPLDATQPLFSFESVEKFVFMGPGYLSFDLLFTGTRDTVRGEQMTFLYREYGRDSTDRPTFERSLQFPTDEHVIAVERLRIEVEPVGYNQLRFRVIADGQPAPTASQ